MFVASYISTSWNVVSKAYVFWDSFSLWETLCLNLDIGSRIYFLYPAETEGLGWGGCFGVSFCAYFSLSVLGVYFGVSFCGSWEVGDLGGYGCLVCYLVYFGAYFWADPAGFWASTSTAYKDFPTARVSPFLTKSLVRIPAAGLLIYTVTLSV